MLSSIFIYIIIAVFVLFLIYKLFFKGKAAEKTSDETTADLQNFEKDFFSRVEAGEKSVLLLTLGNPGDTAFIQSILYADNVPSYIEGKHMNNIYGGISGTMEAVVAVKLFVLESDYDRAREIIENSNIKKGDISIASKE